VQVKRTTERERLARASAGGDEVVIRAPVGKPPVDVKAPDNRVKLPPKQVLPTKLPPGKPVKSALDAPARQDLQEPPVKGKRNVKTAVDAPSSIQQDTPTTEPAPRGDSQVAPQRQQKK
jgi:hypothetical protein